MKVLLDEGIPQRFRFALPSHDVVSVEFAGWKGIKNGVLLRKAEEAGFDVLLTADQNMAYQQNLEETKIAILVLTALKLPILLANADKILAAIDEVKPGSLRVLVCDQ